MLGTLDSTKREVTIIGAGISGLLLAHRLDAAGWQVTLQEAAPAAGGMIATQNHELGLSERAAHSLLATPDVARLCEQLGIPLAPVRARERWIWRNGRARRMPLGPLEVLRLLARAYFVLADGRADPERQALDQWCRRHLGEAALKYLLTPFTRGIYGARPSELEIGTAFPRLVIPRGHSMFSWFFRRWHLRLRGKLPKAPPRGRMVAPAKGMSELTGALEKKLRERLGDRFRVGQPQSELPQAPNLVLCVPAPEAARLLSKEDPALQLALQNVAYAPLLSVTVFAERIAFATPPQGVGVLLPEGTSRKCLGVLFNSSAFEGRVRDEKKWVSLTVMLGGTSRPELLGLTDEELKAIVRAEFEVLLNLAPGARLEMVIHRWERAIPLYDARLRQVWEAATQGWCSKPGRVLFGNYTGQVSVRGMIETVARLP